MTDRDTFAAAQRTCLRIDRWLEGDLSDDADQTLRGARCLLITLAAKLEYADAMLQELSRSGKIASETVPQPAKYTERDNAAHREERGKSTSPKSYQKSDEKRVVCDTKREPVAWIAVFDGHDADGEFVWPDKGRAMEWASARPGVRIAPLYLHPQPALTAEEREAVEEAAFVYEWRGKNWCGLENSNPQMCVTIAATLRSLLERLK